MRVKAVAEGPIRGTPILILLIRIPAAMDRMPAAARLVSEIGLNPNRPRVQVGFRSRHIRFECVVESTGSMSPPDVPKPWGESSHYGEPVRRSREIEDEWFDAGTL